MTDTLHVFFDDVVDTGAADLVWPRNTEQDIYIVDFAGATALAAGAKLWLETVFGSKTGITCISPAPLRAWSRVKRFRHVSLQTGVVNTPKQSKSP